MSYLLVHRLQHEISVVYELKRPKKEKKEVVQILAEKVAAQATTICFNTQTCALTEARLPPLPPCQKAENIDSGWKGP